MLYTVNTPRSEDRETFDHFAQAEAYAEKFVAATDYLNIPVERRVPLTIYHGSRLVATYEVAPTTIAKLTAKVLEEAQRKQSPAARAVDVNLHVYDRIAAALEAEYGREFTRGEAERADTALRMMGLAVQTHADANAVVKACRALDFDFDAVAAPRA